MKHILGNKTPNSHANENEARYAIDQKDIVLDDIELGAYVDDCSK